MAIKSYSSYLYLCLILAFQFHAVQSQLLGGVLGGLGSGNLGGNVNVSGTATWALGVSGNIANPSMFVNGVVPGPLTPNVAISASGMFAVAITSNLNLGGNITVGGAGSTPSINIGNGITVIVNGLVNLLSGTINLGVGASLITLGGLNVTAITPTIINLGTNGVLSVTNMFVTSVPLGHSLGLNLRESEFEASDPIFSEQERQLNLAGSVTAALTIVGSASAVLNLLNTTATIVDATLLLNVIVNIGVSTVITTVGSATVTIGSLLNVVGSVGVNLVANIIVLAGATLNLNAALTVVSATLAVGSNLVINVVGGVVPVLNAVGSLTLAANLLLNVIGSATLATNVVVATAASVVGSLNIFNSALTLVASATAVAVASI